MKSDKIGLFIGTERGFRVLKFLIDAKKNISHVLILDQQEHEIKNFTNAIIELCRKNHIGYNVSSDIPPSKYENYLKKYDADVVFVVSWRFLIPHNCLMLPKCGIFIVHDSLVPKYRGFATTNWVIINGERETGLSLIYAESEIDAGDIVDQAKIKIAENETAGTLNNKFLNLYPKIISDNLDSILSGSNKKISQDHNKATYCCKRSPEDGKIDFKKTTGEIVRFIRGLTYPYPGAFCYYNELKVTIWDAARIKSPKKFVGRVPGKIVQITDRFVDVLTGDSILRIQKIGLGGGSNKFMKPKEIIKSILKSLR